MAQGYIPLWCKTNYSFLEGASRPSEIVERAHAIGLSAIAITDRNGVYGIVRAYAKARELGMRLLYGAELDCEDDMRLVLLVQTRAGYARLCRMITAGKADAAKGECCVPLAALRDNYGLLALLPSPSVQTDSPEHWTQLHRHARRVQSWFGSRTYLGIERADAPYDACREVIQRRLSTTLGIPMVAATPVLYHDSARRDLQDVLRCTRLGTTLDKAGARLQANDKYDLTLATQMMSRFRDDPRLLTRTHEVASRCTFDFAELRYRYPMERLPDGMDAFGFLQDRVVYGAQQRLGNRYVDYVPLIERELSLIKQLAYEGYFLTMYEIVEYCRGQGIVCQGRGSAANSVVCFALGITNVDPREVNVLFERFISEERAEPPDIDLDIEHERREEVIQHVYAKYGRTHAAMVANVITYRAKSAIREVGKVLGIPAVNLDRMAKLKSHHDKWDPQVILDAGLDPDNPSMLHLHRLVQQIVGFPRHLSIHPGGFLLGHMPVTDLVPIENATMADRTVIQWDKDDVETAGLFKVDLLGLGALTLMRKCFELLRDYHPESPVMSLLTVPPNDEPTYDMICASDTVGVFQIESRAQMSMLGRLKPRTYYDLVIEISLVRPGPISGGMVHPYLRRRDGTEPITYPHPSLEPVLKNTLGIPLFQEQVMKLAMVAADYTPGEADQLRRDMAAWKKAGKIEGHRERLISRMAAKGISQEFAERVFEQIKGFGDYGFPESHAASFAHIAYATSYLKCHYPVEFACALLNAQPMGFYSSSTIVNDLKRHQAIVLPLCLLHSQWDCTIEDASSASVQTGSPYPYVLRMGLRLCKGIARDDAVQLVTARESCGRDLAAWMQAAPLNRAKWIRLAETGALDGFGLGRRQALWQVRDYWEQHTPKLALVSQEELPLFAELSWHNQIAWDHTTTRHSVRGHPLEPHRAMLAQRGLPTAQQINQLPDGSRAEYVGVAICRQRPGTAKGVMFMTLEDESGFVNLVIWKDIAAQYRKLIKTMVYFGVTGTVQAAEGVTHFVVKKLWAPNFLGDVIRVRSRDYH